MTNDNLLDDEVKTNFYGSKERKSRMDFISNVANSNFSSKEFESIESNEEPEVFDNFSAKTFLEKVKSYKYNKHIGYSLLGIGVIGLGISLIKNNK